MRKISWDEHLLNWAESGIGDCPDHISFHINDPYVERMEFENRLSQKRITTLLDHNEKLEADNKKLLGMLAEIAGVYDSYVTREALAEINEGDAK